MSVNPVGSLLLDRGRALFAAWDSFVEFTGKRQADKLLNDLTDHPHAFVLACVMDRQDKAERAWLIPYLISKKIGDFRLDTLRRLFLEEIGDLMSKPEPLHRFPQVMSANFHAAVRYIWKVYAGDAAAIWRGKPSSAEVVYRFLQFRGVGPKIASMATNILARDFKVPLADYYSVDVSADTHVRRVFARLGLTREDATTEEVIYRARALSPEFPGLLDLPTWDIGRRWCKQSRPECGRCYMRPVCPTARTVLKSQAG